MLYNIADSLRVTDDYSSDEDFWYGGESWTRRSTTSQERETTQDLKEKIRRIESLYRSTLSDLNSYQRTVLIYGGADLSHDGVDSTSAQNLEEKFTSFNLSRWRVAHVPRERFIEQTFYLDPRETICVFPGGPASGYDKTLKRDIPILKTFNEQGAGVVAVCGASFWTSKESIYEMAPGETWVRQRDWQLFSGRAEGPYFKMNWPSELLAAQSRLIAHSTTKVTSLRAPSPFEHRVADVTLVEEGITGSILCTGGGLFVPDDTCEEEFRPLLVYNPSSESDSPTSPHRKEGGLAAIRVSSPRTDVNPNKGPRVMIMPHGEYSVSQVESDVRGCSLLQEMMPSTLEDIDKLKRKDPTLRQTKSFNDLVMARVLLAAIDDK